MQWLLSAVLLALVPFETPPAPPQIVPVPHDGKAPAPAPTPQPVPIPTSVRVSGAEFEMLTLVGYTGGAVAWDITSPDFGVPVKLKELKPKQLVIGIRTGASVADEHEAPDTPAVAVWAINTGTATVSAWGVKDSKPVKLATYRVDAGQGPRPPPDPPGPKPVPVPVPVPPDAPDAQLVATFKLALDQDIVANRGTKAHAADLAVVFDSGAALLDLGDPAIAPRTVGDLYSKMVLSSVAKGIPRLPYLQSTRAVVEANTPLLNGTTAMTPEIKGQFQAAYRKVAAALTEASK